jgi:CheY-like chemotaxis protein
MTERPRILVVDDVKRIAASVRRALTYEGYDVEEVHDGFDTLIAA